MDSVRQTQKRYCSGAMVSAIIIGMFFILMGHKPIAKGIILGTLFSIVNFILIGETLPLKLGRPKRSAIIVSFLILAFRFVLLAAPILIGIKYGDEYSLFAVIIGLFLVQVAILVDHTIGRIASIQKKQV